MRSIHATSVLDFVSGIGFSGGLNSDIINTITDANMQTHKSGAEYVQLTTDDGVKLDK